jgi:hypothetical protein
MESEELIIHETGDGEGIEGLHEQVVSLLVVLVNALGSEVEELGHLTTLMVSSQHVDCPRKVEFEGVKEEDDFTGERSSIYIVSEEEVFGLLRIASDIEHLHEVIVLSVDISNDGDRVVESQQVRLLLCNGLSLKGTDDGEGVSEDSIAMLFRNSAFFEQVLLEKFPIGECGS